MSCFIVKTGTINRLISFFVKCSYSNDGFLSSVNHIIKDDLGYNLNYDVVSDENPQALVLGLSMVKLNNDVVNYRYDKKDKPELYTFEDIEIKDFYNDEKYLYQILKSLQCYLYQCSEGEYDKTNLYRALKKISYLIMNHIISSTEEYKKAEWD